MDHDNDDSVCAAVDLCARLRGERQTARRDLRAAELQLEQTTRLVIAGAIDYPLALVQLVAERRRNLLALDLVLADLGHDASDALCA